MAEVNIGSFDFNAEGAIRAIGQLSKTIGDLEKQMVELQKEGKDTTAVQQQLATATATLDKALKQETTTMRGAVAQQRALQVATKNISDEAKKAIASQDALDKSTRRVGQGFGVSARGFTRFRAAATSGAQAIGGVQGAVDAAKGGIQNFGNSIANVAAGFGPWGIAIAGAVTILTPYIAGLFEATKVEKSLADATAAATQQIAEERVQLDTSIGVLRDTTASYTERRDAIATLQGLFPDYLANINLEKASQQQLNEIYKVGTFLIEERAIKQAVAAEKQKVLQAQIQAQAAASAELAERLRKFDEQERSLQSESKKGVEERRKAIIENGKKTIEFLGGFDDSRIKALDETEKIALEILQSRYTEEEQLAIQRAKVLEQQNARSKDANKEQQKEQKALAGTLAELRQRQSELNKAREESTTLGDVEKQKELGAELKLVNDAISEAQKRLAEYSGEGRILAGSLADLRAQSAEVRKALEEQTSPEDTARIEELKGQYAELEKQIKALEKALATSTESKGFLEGVKANNSAALEEQKASLQRALSQLRAQQAAANLSVQQQRNAELQSARGNEEKIAALKEKFAAEDEAAERDQAIAVLRIREQLATAELALAQKVSGAFSAETAEAKADLLDIQTEIAALEGKEFTANVTVKTDKESLKKNLEAIASFAEDLAGQVANFAASQVQNTIAQLDSAIDKQKSLLDELLSNEETANATQVQLEKDRLDALNKERERAKNREALIVQAQIAANLALAIARAVAEGGGVASALTVASAIAAATFGFIQAKQTAQNAFYKGTLYVDDASAPNGIDTVNARLTKGEAVLPVDVNRDYDKAVEGVYNRRVPAALANDFFTNTDSWIEAMEAYKNGEPAPKITIEQVRQQRAAERAAASNRTAQNKGDALPLATAMGYIGGVIADQSRTEIRGDKLVKIVTAQSSKYDKLKGKSKGKNA